MNATARRILAATVFLAVPFVSGSCGGGPGVINGHDYSSFYDFGGFDDTNEPADTGTDAFARDVADNELDDDAFRDHLEPADTGDTADKDPGGGDPGSDTTIVTPTVTLVTDRAWEPRARNMIGGAKKSVDLVHLEFLSYATEIKVYDSLTAAAGRGVKVRVLLDDGDGVIDDNQTKVDQFNAVANITAKLDNWNGTTHVKMIIVDDAQVLVGSTNLSKSALDFNHEANLWITDPAAVPEYAGYFDAVWADPSGTKTMDASLGAGGILPIGDGEYVDAVHGRIESATDRVMLVMYDLNQDSPAAKNLTAAIIAAAGRGVNVRAFFERCNLGYASYVTGDNLESAEILEDGGAEVRFDEPFPDNNPYDDVTHAKLLIVDDTVVVYSGNWNNSGLQNNHEAGAVVEGVETVTSAAVNYFNGLWETGVAWP